MDANTTKVGTEGSLVLDAMAGDLIFGGAIDLSDTVDMDGVQLKVQGGFDTSINGRIRGTDGCPENSFPICGRQRPRPCQDERVATRPVRRLIALPNGI